MLDLDAALEAFFDYGLITEVLGAVKSGKEATVYACRANPHTGRELLAAKVYRNRDHRTFKNECVSGTGRVVLDDREARAVANKSRTGRRILSAGWVAGESRTLGALRSAGCDVPRLFATSSGAILIDFVGEEGYPAPQLKRVALEPDEAGRLCARVLDNVERMLANNVVHGDLSEFNILYWEGEITIIDFPQAVDPRQHPNARDLLARDVANVCRYFGRYGVDCPDAWSFTEDLWMRFERAWL